MGFLVIRFYDNRLRIFNSGVEDSVVMGGDYSFIYFGFFIEGRYLELLFVFKYFVYYGFFFLFCFFIFKVSDNLIVGV